MARLWRFVFPALSLMLTAGCGGGGEDTPAVHLGSDVCVSCRMTVDDAKYAAAIRTGDGAVLTYDAIECLVRDLRTRRGADAPAEVWLPDFAAAGELHHADEMTVVRAGFPSPMGGGYAAFADADVAAREAATRDGVAGPLTGFVDGSLIPPAR